MSRLTQHLVNYAAYHRDRRNVATHIIGIPLIVFSLVILLSRPVFDVAGLAVTPALIIAAAATVYYFRLGLWLGIVMGAILGACLWASAATFDLDLLTWFGLGAGMFLIGWIIQFIGHGYEGRKPAFMDELVSLMIGPAFIAAELGFMMGLLNETRTAISEQTSASDMAE